MRYACILIVLLLSARGGLAEKFTLVDCVRVGMVESGAARNARQDQEIAYTKFRQDYSLAVAKFVTLLNMPENSEFMGVLEQRDVLNT